jgi:hypothetical protein
MVGPSAKQGPHQGAQKSTTVNFSFANTSVAKFASVNVAAIFNCFYFLFNNKYFVLILAT